MWRVSLVNGICLLPDAISYSMVRKMQAIDACFDEKEICVKTYAYASNLSDPRITVIPDVATLLMDPHVVQSDAMIFEFGIHYGLFNAILALPGHVRKIVQYHNITPERLIEREQDRQAAERGLRQKANLFKADDILADSEFNRRDLLSYRIQPKKVQVLELPLPEGFHPRRRPLTTPREIEILFVGRFVPAKGALDLVESVIAARRNAAAPLRLTLAGDTTFADAEYLRAIRSRIEESGHGAHINILPNLAQTELVEAYRRAHLLAIPSYHEGYCLPVIEAMSCGCIVVAYDSGNLPYITNGLARSVETGNLAQLRKALEETAASLLGSRPLKLDSGDTSYADFLDRAFRYSQGFQADAFFQRFATFLRGRLTAPGRYQN